MLMWGSLAAAVLLAVSSIGSGMLLWWRHHRVLAAAMAMPAAWAAWTATRIAPLFEVLDARAAAADPASYPPVWPLVLGLCTGSVMALWFIAAALAMMFAWDSRPEEVWVLAGGGTPDRAPADSTADS